MISAFQYLNDCLPETLAVVHTLTHTHRKALIIPVQSGCGFIKYR